MREQGISYAFRHVKAEAQIPPDSLIRALGFRIADQA